MCCHKTKPTPMVTTLSGVEQRPLTRTLVDQRHSITEMAAGATRCFVAELTLRLRIRVAIEYRFRRSLADCISVAQVAMPPLLLIGKSIGTQC